MTITLTVNAKEIDYLRRAVERDLEMFDAESMMCDMEEYAMVEAAQACQILKMLKRVCQDHVYPH